MLSCLERGANCLHMFQLMPLYPTVSLASLQSFLVPAYPGCPGKDAVKRVCSVVMCTCDGLCRPSQVTPMTWGSVDLDDSVHP